MNAPDIPAHGGERVAAALAAHGVKVVFTLCGGHISPILVAAKRRGIRIVDTRDEATAVWHANHFAIFMFGRNRHGGVSIGILTETFAGAGGAFTSPRLMSRPFFTMKTAVHSGLDGDEYQ